MSRHQRLLAPVRPRRARLRRTLQMRQKTRHSNATRVAAQVCFFSIVRQPAQLQNFVVQGHQRTPLPVLHPVLIGIWWRSTIPLRANLVACQHANFLCKARSFTSGSINRILQPSRQHSGHGKRHVIEGVDGDSPRSGPVRQE